MARTMSDFWSKLGKPYLICDILGLAVTMSGTLLTARGAYVEEKDIHKLGVTRKEHNHELEHAFRDQSVKSIRGFMLIAGGSLLQIVATMPQALA
ncbi:MAG: hypothetical protein JWR07_5381 [Nevskia sp.]|nr:hypothetical protein [Nevskia sp.]